MLMSLVQTIRRFRACLLALFVAAQVAGVVPVIYDHTLNVFETTPVAGHSHVHLNSPVATPDRDHHHGVLDLHDQCCALHTLAGPLPHGVDAAAVAFAGVPMVPVAAIFPAQRDPVLPDRPPRLLPLI
jgi:hypothetical protein